MSNLHKRPDPNSKRGVFVYIMRHHAEQKTGAKPEAICDEIFATGRFSDLREVVGCYNWALDNEWVAGVGGILLDASLQRAVAPPSGGLSIRDPEVGKLAHELAGLRNTNMTEAIVHALRSELEYARRVST